MRSGGPLATTSFNDLRIGTVVFEVFSCKVLLCAVPYRVSGYGSYDDDHDADFRRWAFMTSSCGRYAIETNRLL